jgi:hypothetical protein
MKRTLKEYLLATIILKYTTHEKRQIIELENVQREGKLSIIRCTSHSRSWLHPDYSLDRPLPIPKEIRKEIVKLETAYLDFKKELDYLSHFLSVVLRSNVPEETILEFIPPHVIKEFKEDDYRNCISLRRTADEFITAKRLRKEYPTEAYYLNKYLIYLML